VAIMSSCGFVKICAIRGKILFELFRGYKISEIGGWHR
jgi:hypothetical protein